MHRNMKYCDAKNNFEAELLCDFVTAGKTTPMRAVSGLAVAA
jgi:hypothetical protein